MESMTQRDCGFGNLQRQAKKLASDSLSLTTMLAEEASRLNRQDEASRLIALHASISQQLDRTKNNEDAARYRYTQPKLTNSWVGLGMGIAIKMMSKDEQSSAFSNHILKNLGGKERPFGIVLVSIGPKGLPEDVGVVSISRLARESNRQETEIIREMRERGQFLLSEGAFSCLIDRLTIDIQEGRLSLPVSREKLADIGSTGWVKLEPTEPQWVPVPRQQ